MNNKLLMGILAIICLTLASCAADAGVRYPNSDSEARIGYQLDR